MASTTLRPTRHTIRTLQPPIRPKLQLILRSPRTLMAWTMPIYLPQAIKATKRCPTKLSITTLTSSTTSHRLHALTRDHTKVLARLNLMQILSKANRPSSRYRNRNYVSRVSNLKHLISSEQQLDGCRQAEQLVKRDHRTDCAATHWKVSSPITVILTYFST